METKIKTKIEYFQLIILYIVINIQNLYIQIKNKILQKINFKEYRYIYF